jgi:hypothetical protein
MGPVFFHDPDTIFDPHRCGKSLGIDHPDKSHGKKLPHIPP